MGKMHPFFRECLRKDGRVVWQYSKGFLFRPCFMARPGIFSADPARALGQQDRVSAGPPRRWRSCVKLFGLLHFRVDSLGLFARMQDRVVDLERLLPDEVGVDRVAERLAAVLADALEARAGADDGPGGSHLAYGSCQPLARSTAFRQPARRRATSSVGIVGVKVRLA